MSNSRAQGGPLELRFPDLVTMFKQSVAKYGDSPLYGVRRETGWQWITYAEVSQRVHVCAAALRTLGVEPGDRVAVISNNRLEWAIACYATYGCGAAYVPMYEQQLDRDWQHILADSGAKIVFVANDKVRARVDALKKELPKLLHVVCFDGKAKTDWPQLIADHATANQPLVIPDGGALASIIYTSGTTGIPKGARLTHDNLSTNLAGVLTDIPLKHDDRTFAFLPWAHVLGGSTELHGVASVGASTAICERVDQLVEQLPEVAPTMLVAVPRIWNRIYAGLNKQIQGRPKFIQRLFASGIAAAKKQREGKSLAFGESTSLWLARKLIFGKVTARLGGRLKFAVTGSAAISREVAEFIDALGITVFEGYGLTECSGVATVNTPAHRRMGSVGRPIYGSSISLDHKVEGADPTNGEILVHGPGNTSGYENLPEESAKLFGPDGGLRTGDLGRLDDDGFLFITGRVKELYKLENGKYVAPAPLEEQLQLSPFVAQCMIFGSDKPYNVAIIVPAFDRLGEWAGHNGVSLDMTGMVNDPRTKAFIKSEIDRLQDDWKGYEKIRDVLVLDEAFSSDNDMLTPSLKVKRGNVRKKYGDQLAALYTKK